MSNANFSEPATVGIKRTEKLTKVVSEGLESILQVVYTPAEDLEDPRPTAPLSPTDAAVVKARKYAARTGVLASSLSDLLGAGFILELHKEWKDHTRDAALYVGLEAVKTLAINIANIVDYVSKPSPLPKP